MMTMMMMMMMMTVSRASDTAETVQLSGQCEWWWGRVCCSPSDPPLHAAVHLQWGRQGQEGGSQGLAPQPGLSIQERGQTGHGRGDGRHVRRVGSLQVQTRCSGLCWERSVCQAWSCHKTQYSRVECCHLAESDWKTKVKIRFKTWFWFLLQSVLSSFPLTPFMEDWVNCLSLKKFYFMIMISWAIGKDFLFWDNRHCMPSSLCLHLAACIYPLFIFFFVEVNFVGILFTIPSSYNDNDTICNVARWRQSWPVI